MTTASKQSTKADPLGPFSAPVRRWFEASFEGPTPAQIGGWEAISGGDNALICAPTGSGKTLASFLWGIDKLAREPQLGTGVRLVYVSPLKALSYDIERNLRAPLRGIGADISVGLRTGDTSQAERRAMRKTPPDILITTPESLYLMLSSGVREILATTEAVIVDEIHAVAQSKRGAHLALTLERLDHLVGAEERGEGPAGGGSASVLGPPDAAPPAGDSAPEDTEAPAASAFPPAPEARDPEPAEEDEAEPAPEPSAGLSLEELQRVWPAVMDHLVTIAPALTAFFEDARPVGFEEGVVEISFPGNATFNKRKAETPENREKVAEALLTVTGQALKPTYVLLDGEEAPPPESAAPAAAADDSLDNEELLERLKSEFDAEEVS